MLAVYPVTETTAHCLEQMGKILHQIGPNSLHKLLVVTCPSAVDDAQAFVADVGILFGEADIVILEASVSNSTAGRNNLFKAAVQKANTQTEPWIWMEHAMPLQRGWLNLLQEEYNVWGKAFLGCIEKTVYRAVDKDKQPIVEPEPLFTHRGHHMRVGIYPADFGSKSQMLGFLRKPFEHDLQNEIIPTCKDSERIATIWASANFTIDGSIVTGEKTDESEAREVIPQEIEGVAVLHGCRDDSLGKLLLKRGFGVGISAEADQLLEKAKQDRQDEVNELKAELDALKEQYSIREAELTTVIEEMEGGESRDLLQAEVDRLKKELSDVNVSKAVAAATKKIKADLAAAKKKTSAVRAAYQKKIDKLEAEKKDKVLAGATE